MESSVTITTAQPDDAEGIKNVQYKTWLTTYPNAEAGITVDDIEDRFKDRVTPEAIQAQRLRLKDPQKGITVFVAKKDSAVVGACAVECGEKENYLKMLYVLPEFQGMKIGWSLWEEARKLFNTKNATFVLVADYNAKAIEFYNRLGFKDTGERITDERFRMKSGALLREMKMQLFV